MKIGLQILLLINGLWLAASAKAAAPVYLFSSFRG